MRKYLFIGNTNENTGPANVNKGIVKHLSPNFCTSFSNNKLCKYLNSIIKTLFCEVIVVSGLSKIGMYSSKLGKFLGKKTIYIMHGCNEIEFKLNQISPNEKALKYEKYFLNNSDLILAVSERYSKMIQEKYSFCADRMNYLHNGVDKADFDYIAMPREKGRIIAVGGDRKLKNNIVVANAVAKLDDSKKLMVYGHLYHPDALPKEKNIEFKGLVPQKQLYEEMMKSELYVLNSVYEPFALSVFDALLCGCSILVTNVAGALELLNVTEQDVIYDPMDEQYPWMISIGNHVRITEGVKILTHDYSWSVLKNYRGGVFGASGIVEIGDNVFIGMNAIIERNVKIGNNVVIGAGSIVTKDCEENSVYAGVPAKRIMNIDEFLMKRRDKQLDEAKLLARRYYERYRKMPEPAVFHEYFMLFETSESVTNNTVFEKKIRLGDSEEQTFLYMKENAPKFKSYDEFMKYCFEQENNER